MICWKIFVFKFWGTCPQTPWKGLSWLEIFFGHSAFKIELLDLRSEASTKEILSNKCLLLREYKLFKKTHCILATDNSVSHLFTDYKNFQSIIKLGFHHILCNNTETKGHLFCAIYLVSQWEAWLCLWKTENQCCIWVSKLELVDAMETHL